MSACRTPHGELSCTSAPKPLLGTAGHGWMQKCCCCDKLALICPRKRGVSVTANTLSMALTAQTHLDQREDVPVPSETFPPAQNLVQHSYLIGLFSTPWTPAPLIKQGSPGDSTVSHFSCSNGLQEGLAFVSTNTKLKTPPQGYISMGRGWLEKNGFPAALYVLKPINWYSGSTTSCFACQVKPALA